MLPPLMLARCDIQIGGDNGKRALDIIDHVALARIDVTDLHSPTPLVAGIGGAGGLPPEAQNENLIEQRSLWIHEPDVGMA